MEFAFSNFLACNQKVVPKNTQPKKSTLEIAQHDTKLDRKTAGTHAMESEMKESPLYSG